MAPMPDRSVRERWNRRWAERDVAALERAPAEWLVQSSSLLLTAPGRRALDVACGDGRNAGHLARLGFTVDAVDISDVAVEALRAAAAARRLAIRPRRIDLEHAPLPVAAYDTIVQISYLQRDLFGALAEALAPGGILVVETFTRSHVQELGAAMDPRYLLDAGELRHAFPTLTLLRYREGIVQRDEHRRAVASAVARRPPAPRPGR